jgi:hypothetical protein
MTSNHSRNNAFFQFELCCLPFAHEQRPGLLLAFNQIRSIILAMLAEAHDAALAYLTDVPGHACYAHAQRFACLPR